MPRKPNSPANLDLFDAPQTSGAISPDLPSIDNLEQMYDIYNAQYFGGRLPRVKITFSKRMLAAGCYFPQRLEIRISEKYHAIFPDEVYDTLKHEMIHVIHLKHNAEFKKMAKRIGASVRANEHPDLRRPPKYLYVCPHCHIEYPRTKRLRLASCGRCSKRGYDKRFKLILKKNLKQMETK
ncbi:MAG: SprT-like domain-containing protein [candidate division Zixibacteria bacterium]|nr:SprT-like domain-containing protein [candidate division Zixibacteria bacterium]